MRSRAIERSILLLALVPLVGVLTSRPAGTTLSVSLLVGVVVVARLIVGVDPVPTPDPSATPEQPRMVIPIAAYLKAGVGGLARSRVWAGSRGQVGVRLPRQSSDLQTSRAADTLTVFTTEAELERGDV
jgi:hypothetical protein